MNTVADIKAAHTIESVLAANGIEVKGGMACCPFHDDENPSFSIKGGKWKCFAGCGNGDVIELLAKFEGKTSAEYLRSGNGAVPRLESKRAMSNLGDPTAVYPYHDETGKLVYEVRRYEPKDFRPFMPGASKPGLNGVCRVPYRLLEILKADTIWLVEGERDADNLAALGYQATCRAGGSSTWEPELTPWFKDKDVLICGDNDVPGQKYVGIVEAAVKPIAKSVRRIEVPPPAKDITEALEGLSDGEAHSLIVGMLSATQPDRAISVCDITCPVENDPDELLKSRFLCIGGGAMVNGPTGIGKSSFIMQAAILWALGKPFFGIQPARSLKSLIVQAENDDGDLVEQREGVFVGLNLSEREKEIVRANVFIRSENAKTGTTFISGVLRPLLEENRPDLLWLDNLFAYCGCNVSDQEKMSLFLRTQINPLIQELRCAIVIAHHTNKPPSGDQKADWSVSETAYLGSGSGELANWPRAILSIRALKTQGVFELVAGKRGGRLKWKDADDNGTCRRNIAHSNDGLIYWREASAELMEAKKSGPTKHDVRQLMFVGQEMSKEALISKANDLMGLTKAKGFIAELISDGIFKVIEKPRPRTNPAIYLERVL